MSRLSEVTNLPLLKILAYIDFGRVEFVLPPMFDAPRVGMGSEAVVSRLIEVTNLPLFRAVEIGPMDCPCNG